MKKFKKHDLVIHKELGFVGKVVDDFYDQEFGHTVGQVFVQWYHQAGFMIYWSRGLNLLQKITKEEYEQRVLAYELQR